MKLETKVVKEIEETRARFQKKNCAKGCRFVDLEMLKTGGVCCTFAFELNIVDGNCNTRRA